MAMHGHAAGGRKPALDPSAYTVGWLCILECELRAARAMLDEAHDFLKFDRDPNTYVPGRIASHAVVIACSGEAGNMPMASCASWMAHSFPNVTQRLLVGIGGGVADPPRTDIRLGDVVVAAGENGAVAFYGHGKLTQHGMQPKRIVREPLPQVTSVVGLLKSEKDQPLVNILGATVPDIALSAMKLPDVLYQSDSDDSDPVSREARPNPGPVVHYGLIASSELVMKTSGSLRQQILEQIDGHVLCFEMEAASLMNDFPCLVVRGIADYCDAHKQDAWHPYAASAAAAYCKWFLRVLPGAYTGPASLREPTQPAVPGVREASPVVPNDTNAFDASSDGTSTEWKPQPRRVPTPTTQTRAPSNAAHIKDPNGNNAAISSPPDSRPQRVPTPATPEGASSNAAYITDPNGNNSDVLPQLRQLAIFMIKLDILCIDLAGIAVIRPRQPKTSKEIALRDCHNQISSIQSEYDAIQSGEGSIKASYMEDDSFVKFWYISTETHSWLRYNVDTAPHQIRTGVHDLLTTLARGIMQLNTLMFHANVVGAFTPSMREVTRLKWHYMDRLLRLFSSQTGRKVDYPKWGEVCELLDYNQRKEHESAWKPLVQFSSRQPQPPNPRPDRPLSSRPKPSTPRPRDPRSGPSSDDDDNNAVGTDDTQRARRRAARRRDSSRRRDDRRRDEEAGDDVAGSGNSQSKAAFMAIMNSVHGALGDEEWERRMRRMVEKR